MNGRSDWLINRAEEAKVRLLLADGDDGSINHPGRRGAEITPVSKSNRTPPTGAISDVHLAFLAGSSEPNRVRI